MGVCYSQDSSHERNRSQNKISKKFREQTVTVTTNNNNNTSTKETVNTSSSINSLLSEQWSRKEEISKYYTISPTSQIGRGASSTVYKANNSQQKAFAIKQIPKNSPKSKNFLLTEAEISLSLSHRNIIKCYEIFEDQSTISFVFELIEGGDLFDYITSNPNGLLKDEIVIELVIQILDAINYLHNSKGIVHRDIKPENFLIEINEEGTPNVKLIDFGFASRIESNKQMTQFLGTPMYSAPELTHRDPYNEKIDLWAIGVLLFNLLTGCQPFTLNSLIPIEEQIMSSNISFESIANKHLRNLCMNLLERNVEKRYNAKKAYDIAIEIKRIFAKEKEEKKVKSDDYTPVIKMLSQNIGIKA